MREVPTAGSDSWHGNCDGCQGGKMTSIDMLHKTLADDKLIANARFFNGDISKVPIELLMVGMGTVMDYKR